MPTHATDLRNAWESHRWLARVVRLGLFLIPVIASVSVVVAASHLVARPVGLAPTIVWWGGISVVATVTMLVADRSLRRLLPVAALLELSLVFPDQAPSRFKVALRSGTVAQFRKQLESGQAPTTQEAAEILLALVAQLGRHDRLTRGHSERVRAYSETIGEEMGLSAADREKLQWAALLHDVGKLTVPSQILNSPDRPTDEEWSVLKQHPAAAEFFLSPLEEFLGDWRLAASQHHERWEGGGYPSGIAGREISLAGRIVAVADAFDTITAVRSYKKALSPAAGRAEIARCSGGQFDPMVVRAFLGISLGKLRLLMGPLAWLAQSPILASVPAAGSAAASTAVTAAVTATMVASGVVPAAVDMAPDVQSLSVVADEDLPFDLAMVSVNVTLLGTPSPTATLVPTPKPAPTATSTPTAIPAGPMLYLTNPGSGDTASSALLTLAGTLPTAGSLPNYDTDRDADPGLVLIRGSGAGDPDPARRQFWGAVTGPAEALVEAKLKIYAATKDFAVGFGTVDVSVARCDVLLSSCETLGTGSSDFSQGGSHVFKQITVNVLLAGGPTPARPFLRLSVAPSATSASDLWLAYDTAAQPSYLTLS